MTDELADRVAAAATGVDGVAGLRAGRFGEVATLLGGRRVDGVKVTEDVVEVHVAALMGTDLAGLGDRVREAVGPVGRPVDVYVDEILPG